MEFLAMVSRAKVLVLVAVAGVLVCASGHEFVPRAGDDTSTIDVPYESCVRTLTELFPAREARDFSPKAVEKTTRVIGVSHEFVRDREFVKDGASRSFTLTFQAIRTLARPGESQGMNSEHGLYFGWRYIEVKLVPAENGRATDVSVRAWQDVHAGIGLRVEKGVPVELGRFRESVGAWLRLQTVLIDEPRGAQ